MICKQEGRTSVILWMSFFKYCSYKYCQSFQSVPLTFLLQMSSMICQDREKRCALCRPAAEPNLGLSQVSNFVSLLKFKQAAP